MINHNITLHCNGWETMSKKACVCPAGRKQTRASRNWQGCVAWPGPGRAATKLEASHPLSFSARSARGYSYGQHSSASSTSTSKKRRLFAQSGPYSSAVSRPCPRPFFSLIILRRYTGRFDPDPSPPLPRNTQSCCIRNAPPTAPRRTRYLSSLLISHHNTHHRRSLLTTSTHFILLLDSLQQSAESLGVGECGEGRRALIYNSAVLHDCARVATLLDSSPTRPSTHLTFDLYDPLVPSHTQHRKDGGSTAAPR